MRSMSYAGLPQDADDALTREAGPRCVSASETAPPPSASPNRGLLAVHIDRTGRLRSIPLPAGVTHPLIALAGTTVGDPCRV
jgi:hypothetical protein